MFPVIVASCSAMRVVWLLVLNWGHVARNRGVCKDFSARAPLMALGSLVWLAVCRSRGSFRSVAESTAVAGQFFLPRLERRRVILPTANSAVMNRFGDLAVGGGEDQFASGGLVGAGLAHAPVQAEK